MAEQTAGFGSLMGGCDAGRGSGQERGLGGSYCSAVGQVAVTASATVEVHAALQEWRLESRLACCHRH